jgi:hypothetical protein
MCEIDILNENDPAEMSVMQYVCHLFSDGALHMLGEVGKDCDQISLCMQPDLSYKAAILLAHLKADWTRMTFLPSPIIASQSAATALHNK